MQFIACDPAPSSGSPPNLLDLEGMVELFNISGSSLSDDFLLDDDSGLQSRVQVKIAIDPHAITTHTEPSNETTTTLASPQATYLKTVDMPIRKRADALSPSSPSTVHTPLIASTSKIDDAEVPPTTNSMTSREKKKLVKSAKKVGKVLGEAGVVPDANEDCVRDPREKQTFLKSVTKLSKSLSGAIFSEDDQSARGLIMKDHTAGRKRGHKSNASYSATTLSYHPAAYPVTFNNMGAYPFGIGAFEVPVISEPEKSVSAPSSPPVLKVNVEKRPRRIRSSSLSLFSTSSVLTSTSIGNSANSTDETHVDPESTESRLRRAKAERLSRRLGVIVPSQFILSSAIATTIQTEPDTSTCTVLKGSWKRQRNLSLQPGKTLSDVQAASSTLKRSNSEKNIRSGSSDSEAPGALRERLRVINVRRAMKMANVFGSRLPDGVLQVSNNPRTCVLGEDLELTDEDRQRLEYLWYNDRNTFYDLLGIEKQDVPPPHRRVRSASYVSSIAPSVAYNDWDDASTADDHYTLPITIHHERGLTRSAATSGPKPKPLKFGLPPPTTPPPFSAYTQFASQIPSKPQSTTTSGTSASGSKHDNPVVANSTRPGNPRSSSASKFRAKRERAAKLSKFFGVGYQDLFNTMMHGYTITVEKSIDQTDLETDIRLDKGKSGKVKETTERRGDRGDMKEVIDRLRELRA